MLNVPIKMHARRSDMHLSISSGRSPSGLSSNPSATLSPRFPPSRQALLFGPSPPPSPALPSLLPRHGKKPVPSTHRTLTRVIVTFGAFLVLAWLALQAFTRRMSTPPPTDNATSAQYEMVGDSSLPDEPAAVIVTDTQGKPRWTVSIPSTYTFPLRPEHYREICKQSDEMSMHIADLGGASKLQKRHLSYYGVDPNFMDVHEAERQGVLGRSAGLKGTVCAKSLTYVLETADAGLGSSLMGLWMAYGLAQKEGRSFFVDDTRWPYGSYSTFFKPPPSPGCTAPPGSHRLPCPHSAAHLVVSAATFSHTFGHQFQDEFEDPKKMGVARQESIFALARAGYEALFEVADAEDAKYIADRRVEIVDRAHLAGGTSVGVHVRRGDKHPWEFQYSKDYLPLTRYIDEVRQVLAERFGDDSDTSTEVDDDDAVMDHPAASTGRAGKHTAAAFFNAVRSHTRRAASTLTSKRSFPGDQTARESSAVLIASDDPDVYDMPEVTSSHAQRAQARIVLASKSALEAMADGAGYTRNKYLDEIHGWEGGFFRAVFWALGSANPSTSTGSSGISSANAEEHEHPTEGALALRAMVGRAYMLDLALLAQADSVVCGVSAVGCRLLAVMMGWDRAIAKGQWRNVDGGGSFDWTGIVW